MKYKNKFTNEEVVANTYVENYIYSNNSNYELIEEDSKKENKSFKKGKKDEDNK